MGRTLAIPIYKVLPCFVIFSSLLFLLHAGMCSHQVINDGLAPRIGLVLGQSWVVIPTSGKNHFYKMNGDVGMAGL